ncbi:MAG: hypothetical protein H6849_03490 [Alphaproteobacteria bacterium]|nr:MAG: hypothetical protein H6849_03490 [Alphaproteobacteria bacterium]
MSKEKNTLKIRRWPLRGYIVLTLSLFLCVGLLRNQTHVAGVFNAMYQVIKPMTCTLSDPQKAEICACTKGDSLGDSEESVGGFDDKTSSSLGALFEQSVRHNASEEESNAPSDAATIPAPASASFEAPVDLLPEDPPIPQVAPTDRTPCHHCDAVRHNDALTPEPVVSTPSCALSFAYARALLGGDMHALQAVLHKSCSGIADSRIDRVLRNFNQQGAGTYFRLIRTYQQNRLLIHKLRYYDSPLADKFMAIHADGDVSGVDPVGRALEKLSFVEAKSALIQLMGGNRTTAKKLAPLLMQIDAYARLESFVHKNCQSGVPE